MTWWDLSIQTKSSTVLQQNNFRLLQVTGGSGFTLYKITLTNSPKFHVGTSVTDTFTGWGVKLITPSLAYSKANYACASGTYPAPNQAIETISTCFTPETVKNTDGIDPGNSTNVTVAYSFVSTGDDNIVPKAGSSAGGLSKNHLYAHNRFYYGHGMSIGSETYDGLDGMKVWDLVTDGMDVATGLRIKSDSTRGGEVKNVLYQNICMRRVKEPLVFDPFYSSGSGTKYPNFHDITIQDFHQVNYSGATYNKGTPDLQRLQQQLSAEDRAEQRGVRHGAQHRQRELPRHSIHPRRQHEPESEHQRHGHEHHGFRVRHHAELPEQPLREVPVGDLADLIA